MKLTTTHRHDIAILELNGRYDAYTMNLVEEWLTQEKKQVVIDMSKVNFIDNAALKSLKQQVEKRQGQQGYIRLCSLSQSVQIIMELTNYVQTLEIHASQVEAIETITYALVA